MPSSNSRYLVVNGNLHSGYKFRGPYAFDKDARADADATSGHVHELLLPVNPFTDVVLVFATLLDALGLRAFDDERLSHLQALGLSPTEVGKYMTLAHVIHIESRGGH